jgi:hypothetical protein
MSRYSKCNRCGEGYNLDAPYATSEHCGTCIFINGPLPEAKVISYSASKAPKDRWDSEEAPAEVPA